MVFHILLPRLHQVVRPTLHLAASTICCYGFEPGVIYVCSALAKQLRWRPQVRRREWTNFPLYRTIRLRARCSVRSQMHTTKKNITSYANNHLVWSKDGKWKGIYIIVLTVGAREGCRHRIYLYTFSEGFSRRVVVQFTWPIEDPICLPRYRRNSKISSW